MPCHASPGVWDEQIPLTPDRLDPLGCLGFVTELATQARDTNVEHAVHAVVFAFEEVFEEGLARLDFPGMGGQVEEQIELGARQRDRLPVEVDRARGSVDGKAAELQRLALRCERGAAAPQERADAGE